MNTIKLSKAQLEYAVKLGKWDASSLNEKKDLQAFTKRLRPGLAPSPEIAQAMYYVYCEAYDPA